MNPNLLILAFMLAYIHVNRYIFISLHSNCSKKLNEDDLWNNYIYICTCSTHAPTHTQTHCQDSVKRKRRRRWRMRKRENTGADILCVCCDSRWPSYKKEDQTASARIYMASYPLLYPYTHYIQHRPRYLHSSSQSRRNPLKKKQKKECTISLKHQLMAALQHVS